MKAYRPQLPFSLILVKKLLLLPSSWTRILLKIVQIPNPCKPPSATRKKNSPPRNFKNFPSKFLLWYVLASDLKLLCWLQIKPRKKAQSHSKNIDIGVKFRPNTNACTIRGSGTSIQLLRLHQFCMCVEKLERRLSNTTPLPSEFRNGLSGVGQLPARVYVNFDYDYICLVGRMYYTTILTSAEIQSEE